jgi:Ca2+/Na+ antiporter
VLASLSQLLSTAESFADGAKWLGTRLKLAEGARGSVLSAVGSALPETVIPVAAIIVDVLRGELFTPQGKAQATGLQVIASA